MKSVMPYINLFKRIQLLLSVKNRVPRNVLTETEVGIILLLHPKWKTNTLKNLVQSCMTTLSVAGSSSYVLNKANTYKPYVMGLSIRAAIKKLHTF
jgi:hypothetical protein